MSNYSQIKGIIDAAVYENHQQAITGDAMNTVLNGMVSQLGAHYKYMGYASPSTDPGTPDENVFYLATEQGAYPNFGNLSLTKPLGVFKWDGAWTLDQIAIDTGTAAGLLEKVNANTAAINAINAKIPPEASTDNKLADKAYVDRAVSTNTGTFVGTFGSVSELPTDDVKANDYAYVVEDGVFKRYKYNGSAWLYEYSLDNTAFSDYVKAVNITAQGIVFDFAAGTDKTFLIDPAGGLSYGAGGLGISSLKSTQVIAALGYTPFDASQFTAQNIVSTLGNTPVKEALHALNADTAAVANRVAHPLYFYDADSDAPRVYDGSAGLSVTIPSAEQIALWDKICSLFDIDADGNVYVTNNRGFYGNSFLSARGADPEAGQGGTGLDEDALWDILGTSSAQKIDASHIPALGLLAGTVSNAQLANSSITVAGYEAPLGGGVTVAQIATALTGAGYKLTDTTYGLATDTTAGLVKTGYLTQVGTKNYGVKLNSLGQMYVSVPWTDTVTTLASLGITATAAELNKLDGLATTATELGYVHGVTSNIQTQLNAKANASALAAYALKDGSNASGTWPISISGDAATLGGYGPGTLSRLIDYYASDYLTAVGWYRVFTAGFSNARGMTVMLYLWRSYSYTNNEAYIFNISIAFDGRISITQTSGGYNVRLIDKIRVVWVNSGACYIDFHIGISSQGDRYYVSGKGVGTFQAPAAVSETVTGNVTEFSTVNGVASNYGFTGDLSGTAANASMLDGYHASSFQKAVDSHYELNLTSNNTSGGKWNVLLLHEDTLSSAGNSIAGRSVQGTFYFYRPSGNVVATINVNSGAGYNITWGRSAMSIMGGENGWGNYSFVTCTYKGRCYRAIKFSSSQQVYAASFRGTIRSKDTYFGVFVPYATTSGTVLDSEVNGSIKAFTNISKTGFVSSVSAPTFTGALSGNASSATKLATARSLWGQSFNGENNVNGHIYLDSQSHRIFFGISGTTAYISAANGYFIINRATNTNDAGNLLRINLSNGAVGINAIPSSMLHVGGTGYFSSNLEVAGTIHSSTGIWSDGYVSAHGVDTTSDRRFKDGIAPLDGRHAIAVIRELRPSTWTWNALAKVKGRSAGFVAQEVENILPDAIRKTGGDRHLALNYQMLHAYEVAALQAHDDEIQRLRRRVAELENKIKDIWHTGQTS